MTSRQFHLCGLHAFVYDMEEVVADDVEAVPPVCGSHACMAVHSYMIWRRLYRVDHVEAVPPVWVLIRVGCMQDASHDAQHICICMHAHPEER